MDDTGTVYKSDYTVRVTSTGFVYGYIPLLLLLILFYLSTRKY